jgi:UDP-N-acetylglucosamine--N-acetylmuramyl-(pentapeptide) pyrophosphoryl-undecaprenol N-acetylglucosamine transferase
MRIYFAPCGIGLGHVGRNVPIARELEKQKATVVFSTYLEGSSYVKNEKMPLINAPPIGFQVKPDGSIDFRRTAVNPGPIFASFTLMKQIDAEVKQIKRFNPDVVVSDSRASTLLAARLLEIPRICILNQFQVIIPRRKRFLRLARLADSIMLTLIGKIWTSGNTVLIPDFPPPYTVCTGNLNIPKSYRKNVRLIGPILPVHPADLESKDELRKKLKLPTDKTVIFVPVSGSTKEKAFLTGLLRKILLDFPEDYEIVMSLGYPKIEETMAKYAHMIIYDWIPNRFEYLKASDLVICRAGHGTITQAMCYGVPSILIPTPNHTEQLNNALQAEKLDVGRFILQENLTKAKLLRTIEQTLKSAIPRKLEEIKNETHKYDGLKNAVDVITEKAEK